MFWEENIKFEMEKYIKNYISMIFTDLINMKFNKH